MNGVGDVLDAALAAVGEKELRQGVDLIVHAPADADRARRRQRLEPGRDIDTVAVDVAVIDQHVAIVDADPELDTVLVSSAWRAASPRWISSAQRTASTALENSTNIPSPMLRTRRPLYLAMVGSISSPAWRAKRACVSSSLRLIMPL